MHSHDVPARVDHVGVAVRSVETAGPVLSALGPRKLSDEAVVDGTSVPVDDAGEDGRYRWAYYELGDASRLELLAPLGDAPFLEEASAGTTPADRRGDLPERPHRVLRGGGHGRDGRARGAVPWSGVSP